MPYLYVYPKGDKKLEFWMLYRNGEHAEVVGVPETWDEDDIKSELDDWCAKWGHQYDYRYGWNEEDNYGSRR